MAEKRKILRERENQRGSSTKPSEETSRSKKPTRPTNLKKDVKRLFERVILNLFHDGSIIVEGGKSRKWDQGEAELVNSIQLWKHKNSDTQSQYGDSTLISEVSLASTGGSDDLQLSDEDEGEDAYAPAIPCILRKPVISAIKYASQGRLQVEARTKTRGAPEEDILQQLKNLDSRWDHITSLTTTLEQLEKEDVIWEVSSGVWAMH